MEIRFIEKKSKMVGIYKKFYIQKSIKILGKYYWFYLHDMKQMRTHFILNLIGQIVFAFIWVAINRKGDFETGLELLLNPVYIFWVIVLPMFLYQLKSCRKQSNFYSLGISFDYRGKEFNYDKIENLTISSKKTIFGKLRKVYYTDKKILRRQKLQKLQSIFK